MLIPFALHKLPKHILTKIHINRETGCWEFQGKDPSSNGYQRTWYKGVRSMAHRTVYQLLVGGNIEGKQLDHTCCNRKCCNPAHLVPMTHKQNCKLRDQRAKRKLVA